MAVLMTLVSLLGLTIAAPSNFLGNDVASQPRTWTTQTGTSIEARTSFLGDCRYLTVRDSGKTGLTTLVGQCVDDAGAWLNTELNLNQCLGSPNGVLTYQADGDFDEFCHPCIIGAIEGSNDLSFKCNCVNDAGLKVFTSIQMGHEVDHALAVKSANGRFVCGEKQGVVSG